MHYLRKLIRFFLQFSSETIRFFAEFSTDTMEDKDNVITFLKFCVKEKSTDLGIYNQF